MYHRGERNAWERSDKGLCVASQVPGLTWTSLSPDYHIVAAPRHQPPTPVLCGTNIVCTSRIGLTSKAQQKVTDTGAPSLRHFCARWRQSHDGHCQIDLTGTRLLSECIHVDNSASARNDSENPPGKSSTLK